MRTEPEAWVPGLQAGVIQCAAVFEDRVVLVGRAYAGHNAATGAQRDPAQLDVPGDGPADPLDTCWHRLAGDRPPRKSGGTASSCFHRATAGRAARLPLQALTQITPICLPQPRDASGPLPVQNDGYARACHRVVNHAPRSASGPETRRTLLESKLRMRPVFPGVPHRANERSLRALRQRCGGRGAESARSAWIRRGWLENAQDQKSWFLAQSVVVLGITLAH